jgi:hypothetical protein
MATAEFQPIRYRYTGDGTTYVEGVPARDLTRAEWNALTAEQKKAVRSSGLYERAAGRQDDEPDEGAEEQPADDAENGEKE